MRWWRWAANTRRAKMCAACVKRHGKRKDRPACRECEQREPPLLADNVPAVRLMLACETQWRAGFGGAYGLDYPAVFQVAAALKIPVDAAVFRGLRALEHEQLAIWQEEADRHKDKDA